MAVGFRELVGRDEEVASLLALLDARNELSAVAGVTGEAGIGKTTLSLAAVEAAQARGYLVLSCRPAEAEAAFSFFGLVDLIGGVLPDVLPQLLRPADQSRAGVLDLLASGLSTRAIAHRLRLKPSGVRARLVAPRFR